MASVLLAALIWAFFAQLCHGEPNVASGIRVKYVHGDAVYLEAGSSAGLSEGLRLMVMRREQTGDRFQAVTVGEIEIESVVSTSAAGRIINSKSEIVPGDTAYLSQESLHVLQQRQIARDNQKYLQIVSFTEGTPAIEEIRENLPKPPLPEINRIRGRIGIDTSILQMMGTGNSLSQAGFVLQLDATRLGGSHWNIKGYQRGRIQSSSDYQNQTITDLINRTYQLNLAYDNPHSKWVAGAGRLLIPWAASLSTMDGFYLGRRIGQETVGVFGGTNPDPTSWNYDRHRQTAGVFVNLERGDYRALKFSSTSGLAASRINWNPDRQFGFFENRLFYKDFISIYSDVEADLLSSSNSDGNRRVVLSRNYLTTRIQPYKMISFDLSENYYRNIPTFDARLIGTGLLDQFLFQGLNGGIRLTLPYRLGLYGNTGRSSRTGDQRPSWNYRGGISLGNILNSKIRAEYQYSRFDVSFGRGTYQTAILNREVGEGLRFELQLGQQAIHSAFTTGNRARFVNGSVDWYLSARYFTGIGLTAYRGQGQSYNQYSINLGYRFNNHRK
jgi:hypothetical protein